MKTYSDVPNIKAIFSNLRFAQILAVVLFGMSSCRSIKPYEKEYLLHPVMDDARVERLSAPYGKSRRPIERLANAGGSGGSTSCPTCGGK